MYNPIVSENNRIYLFNFSITLSSTPFIFKGGYEL
jgi:hypothetical protein